MPKRKNTEDATDDEELEEENTSEEEDDTDDNNINSEDAIDDMEDIDNGDVDPMLEADAAIPRKAMDHFQFRRKETHSSLKWEYIARWDDENPFTRREMAGGTTRSD
ncbi:hypothetical protein P153DRAFT_361965 [Dothidotthia symphoricarpi CBS 119687]|uniref:Uncharacterized protein n=1 Tax=Dothidotthia symphoricarpi CBS 119687 TaxID=1392245 RepID=A0A6A5ZXB6_9PLEO|nr:uncharacterized protein P153DRAFT_361965 [Dothidotthia symphoricarpi CBS 119687]KAF2123543.1 hypothetical protein P153DRAFT_361965 [Dothidotthia symphoricarpi CBS 119687]